MAFPPQAQQQRPPVPQQQGQQPQQQPMQEMEQDMGDEQEFESTIDGEELQMLLFSRVKELNPQELQTLDSIITPETVPVLFKLFPELGILFEQGSQIQSFMQQGGQQGAGGGMEQQMQPQQQGQPMEDEEERNPLVNDNLSSGLMR